MKYFYSLICITLAICDQVDAFSPALAVGAPSVPGGSYHNRITTAATTTTTTSKLFVRPSKWDNLVDEEEEDDVSFYPVKPDMIYIPRNAVRQHKSFMAIREAAGKTMTNDLYVREPESEVLWYAGKVARVSAVSVEQCVARQWNLIQIHAGNMRPIELFPSRGKLEIWTAPGDTEMEVAYNRPDLILQEMKREVEGADSVKTSMVGFQGEVYQNGEDGFRTWRKRDGSPARPEINPGGETRPPTEEELIQLQNELKDKGIYEDP